MNAITLLISAYILLFISLYLHEMGHRPKEIRLLKLFPIPSLAAMNSASRYGGLMINSLIFLGIWHFQPSNFYLQMLGLINWIYVMAYLLIGSFNHEPKYPRWMQKYVIADDVKNEHRFIAVPIAIATFWLLKEYYIPILMEIIRIII